MTKTLTLNPSQKKAVRAGKGPVMVIAGPGTGKTLVLSQRIAWLVDKKLALPSHILCLTFTESAAQTMRERLLQGLGPEKAYRIDVETFHSLANKILLEYPEEFGFSRDLNPITDLDKSEIIRKVLDRLAKTKLLKELRTFNDAYFYFPDIIRRISEYKREGVTPSRFQKLLDEWRSELDSWPEEKKHSRHPKRRGRPTLAYEKELRALKRNQEFLEVFRSYQREIARRSFYDYEDMILKASAGLRKNPYLKEEYRRRYQWVLVDEFQDTSGAQLELLMQLAGENNPNLFIVGDDDQSIFRFQGASIENLISFAEKFPQAQKIVLSHNYRSPATLLARAGSLIAHNKERAVTLLGLGSKNLKAQRQSRGGVKIKSFADGASEHAYLAEAIKKLINKGVEPSEVAVLYRQNAEGEELFDYLAKERKIPARLEVKKDVLRERVATQALKIMQAAANPLDSGVLAELLVHPAPGISLVEATTILRRFEGQRKFRYLFEFIKKERCLSKKTYDFVKTIGELNQLKEVHSPDYWLIELLEKIGFTPWILKRPDWPYQLKILQGLSMEVKRLAKREEEAGIDDILTTLRRYQQLKIPILVATNIAEPDSVRLMTVHQAKGREFDYVFVVHATHNRWGDRLRPDKLPAPPAVTSKSRPARWQIREEERRLFYVALTRAKKQAVITLSSNYPEAGRDRLVGPSIFVKELEEAGASLTALKLKKEAGTQALKEAFTTLNSPQKNKQVLQKLAREFVLTPTALNYFLACPVEFWYRSFLRIPIAPEPAQQYGSMVHFVLQRYFNIWKKDGRRPARRVLLSEAKWYVMRRTSLTRADKKRYLSRAEDAFRAYWNSHLQNSPPALEVEFSFKKRGIKFKNIPITGKLDKIEKIQGPGRGVRIVDYKTSKAALSVNAIKGRTKSSRGEYWRQVLFYRLLLDSDPALGYQFDEAAFDFVETGRRVLLDVPDDEYQAFKELVQAAGQRIRELNFTDTSLTKPCQRCYYCKVYGDMVVPG